MDNESVKQKQAVFCFDVKTEWSKVKCFCETS